MALKKRITTRSCLLVNILLWKVYLAFFWVSINFVLPYMLLDKDVSLAKLTFKLSIREKEKT